MAKLKSLDLSVFISDVSELIRRKLLDVIMTSSFELMTSSLELIPNVEVFISPDLFSTSFFSPVFVIPSKIK